MTHSAFRAAALASSLAAGCAAASTAIAAPFGINPAQDTPESLGCAATNSPTIYFCSSLPSPRSDMERYILQYEPSVGFCSYKAVGPKIGLDPAGTAIRSKADQIAEEITPHYGRGNLRENVNSRATSGDPMHWAAEFWHGERSYAYHWQVDPEVDTVVTVKVSAEVYDPWSGYLVIELQTALRRDCAEKARAMGASRF